MLLRDKNNRLWIAAVLFLAAAGVAWYAVESARAGRLLGGRSRPGLIFGAAGGLICLFEMLLWPRKSLRRWGQTLRLGRAQDWMRAHIWLGLLSLPLLIMHGGVFPWSWGGTLSTGLMALFLAVIASGIWGLAMQQIIPRRLLDEVSAETIVSQIDFVRAQLRDEAARLVLATCGQPAAETEALGAGRRVPDGDMMSSEFRVAGKPRGAPLPVAPEPVADSGALLDFYRDLLGPYLCPDPLYHYYGDEDRREGRSRPPKVKESTRSPLRNATSARLIFENIKIRLDPKAHPTVDVLADLCAQRRQFETQARLHGWLHDWLAIHLPLSVALIVLMVVHVVIVWKYL